MQRDYGNADPWKPWKAAAHLPTAPTGLGKRAPGHHLRVSHIPTAPDSSHSRGKDLEKKNQDQGVVTVGVH